MQECIGPFQVLREIGRGQNGAVYEAHDTRRDEVVALKVLHVADIGQEGETASPRGEAALLRFAREADAIQRLTHPNIVRIRDAGADKGKLYIAMERLHGETLRARLGRGPLTVDEAAAMALQVASALAFAHERGITHRDVKPDNIFLLSDGTTKLMDFGAARVTGEHSLTQTGSVIGSPAYMAPEQVSGDPTDGRTDIWGLAATIYEAVTNRKPFPGDSVAAVMYAILHRRPDFSLVPSAALARVLERAMARKPGARHAAVADFAEDLRRFPVADARPAPVSARTRPVALALAAVGAVALGFLATNLLPRPDRTTTPAPLSVPGLAAPPTAQMTARPNPAPPPEKTPATSTAALLTVEEKRAPPPSAEQRPPVKPAAPQKPSPAPVRVASSESLSVPRAAPAPPQRATPQQATPRRTPPLRPERALPAVVVPKEKTPPQAAGAGDREAIVDYREAPVLPPRLRGFQGAVVLHVDVDEDGVVTEVEIHRSSGDEEIDRAAARALLSWQYSPAFRNGKAVPTIVEETIAFNSEKRSLE